MNEKGVMITSSPAPTPSAIGAINKASVPLATVIQGSTPTTAARLLRLGHFWAMDVLAMIQQSSNPGL